MLTQLLGTLTRRNARHWTEPEVRELIATGDFARAHAASETLHPGTVHRDLVKQCLQAEIAFRTHQDAEAEALYQRTLEQAPGFADAHHGLSLLMHARNEFEGAFQHALFACNSAVSNPRYLAQLGLCHLCMGNYQQAEDSLRHALHHSPTDKTAWNNLGISLLSRSRVTEARSCFVNALKLDPSFEHARRNLDQLDTDTAQTPASVGTEPVNDGALTKILDGDEDSQGLLEIDADSPPEAWHAGWAAVRNLVIQGQRDQAIAAIETLMLSNPDAEELAALANRMYRVLGEPDSGLAVLHAFLIRHPDSAIVHQAMGEALMHYADHALAESHLKRAIALGLRNQRLLKSLSKTLNKQDKYNEAKPLQEECQERWPSDINLAHVAIAHYHTCEYPQALAALDRLQADDLVTRLGLQAVYAQTLIYSGRIDEALVILDELVKERGSSHNLRATRAAVHLMVEDFAPGWDGYRYRQLGLRSFRVLPIPEWQGEDLAGKTIVVLAEQGLGDQIMFASCLPDLLALKPARVVVEAINRVAKTLERSFPECEFIATNQGKDLDWLRRIQGADCFVPLGELPRHFRRNLASFPRRAYLRPDAERVRYWRTRLESLGPGPYLGTSWRGGTELTRTAIRTLSPDLLQPLTSALPAQWISLQYGKVQDELAIATTAGVRLTHWPEAIADLDEFAALTAALDGVFTVCNTTVHYAGAVGQRVWVLAPHVPEWRYGLRNSHMPWYSTVEVLRQPALNAWPEVVSIARQCLIDNYRASTDSTN